MMFAAGILGLLGAFFPSDKVKMAMLIGPVMVATLVPYVMSYVWFRKREEKRE